MSVLVFQCYSIYDLLSSHSHENTRTLEHENTDKKQRLEARVTGRVQGVGFRHFTTTAARRLGLSGWVRNERDGSVCFVAEGTRADLEQLLRAVHDGPPAARVQNVAAQWSATEETFDGFHVRY